MVFGTQKHERGTHMAAKASWVYPKPGREPYWVEMPGRKPRWVKGQTPAVRKPDPRQLMLWTAAGRNAA